MVRDVQGVDDNPFNFETVKKNILEALKDYEGRIKVTLGGDSDVIHPRYFPPPSPFINQRLR